MKHKKPEDHRLHLNRHVQWRMFNQRVLEEARNPCNPLLEGVKSRAVTANIRARSIVGRFLEHRRISSFENGASAKCFWEARTGCREIDTSSWNCCFP